MCCCSWLNHRVTAGSAPSLAAGLHCIVLYILVYVLPEQTKLVLFPPIHPPSTQNQQQALHHQAALIELGHFGNRSFCRVDGIEPGPRSDQNGKSAIHIVAWSTSSSVWLQDTINQASPDTVTLHLIQKNMNHLFELEYFWSWSLQQSKLEQQQKRTRTNSERVSYIIYQHSAAWMFKLRRIIECSDLMDCYGLFVLCNVPGTVMDCVHCCITRANNYKSFDNKLLKWVTRDNQ